MKPAIREISSFQPIHSVTSRSIFSGIAYMYIMHQETRNNEMKRKKEREREGESSGANPYVVRRQWTANVKRLC